MHVSLKEYWGHESQQKLQLGNEPPTEMKGMCWKEKTSLSGMQSKTTAGILLQVSVLPGPFRCWNDIFPDLLQNKTKQALKQRRAFIHFFPPSLERCEKETLKLRANKARELMAK